MPTFPDKGAINLGYHVTKKDGQQVRHYAKPARTLHNGVTEYLIIARCAYEPVVPRHLWSLV